MISPLLQSLYYQRRLIARHRRVGPITYWQGGDPAGIVEPGDELRLCRYEGDNAIVTVWSHGTGYVIPRSAVSELREEPPRREVAEQDVAYVGQEIEDIQQTYLNEQDWHLLELARQHGVSLSMLTEIRSAGTRMLIRG